MERRPALALAASVAVTVAFAAGAIVVNTGLLRHDHPKRVGKLDAQNIVQLDPTTVPASSSTAPRVRVIVVDETVPAPTAAPNPGASPAPTGGSADPGGNVDRGGNGGRAGGAGEGSDPTPAATPSTAATPPATSPPTTRSSHEDDDDIDEPEPPEPTEPAEPIEGGHDDD